VRISISDTGCGLPAEPELIFQPFYTTKKDGLGLGLAICRSIVTAHQGRLWAEARGAANVPPGVAAATGGTTLHLELPASEGVSGEGQMASGGPERHRHELLPPPDTSHQPPASNHLS